jgi:CRP-like cAMP-binding protein
MSTTLFADFTETEFEAFCSLVERVEAKPGECIVRQDERGDSMYILRSGEARVVHKREGHEIELAILKEGDFFGELALVDEGPRSADVEAISDCQLIKVPQATIRALAGVYPSAAFKLLVAVGRVLVQRMRKGNQKYIDSLLVSRVS